MAVDDRTAETMRTVRFHQHGEPGDVLRLETVEVPDPGSGRVLVRVLACGLTPADWALCRGLFSGSLPRGIGIDVSGTVETVGEGVTDVGPGDLVFGTADWANCSSAGASERAVMNRWFHVPAGLDPLQAAALPMALETAYRCLDQLGLRSGQTVVINAAGTTVGFAAVQLALLRGARVIATAGETYAARLRELGAVVTPYGEGLVERVRALGEGPADLAFDPSPVHGALADLIQLAGGEGQRVLTFDFNGAVELGARDPFRGDPTLRFDVFPEYAQVAAEGRLTIPVARTFPLEEWRAAMEISLGGHPHGKLLLLPGG